MGVTLKDRGVENHVKLKGELVGEDAEISIEGNHNSVVLGDQVSFHGNSGGGPRIQIEGDRNSVRLDDFASLKGVGFIRIRGNDNRVAFGHHCSGPFRIDIHTSGATFLMGEHTTSVGMLCTMHEPQRVLLGRDCQISSGVWITVSDMHSVIDLDSGSRINPGADVIVGDHVWFGFDCKILKGIQIGENSIIATGAIVTRDVPANCVVAGNPARIIRENVTWSRKLLDDSSPATAAAQSLSATSKIPLD